MGVKTVIAGMAAALILGASPAMAQKADPDAVCLAALTFALQDLANTPEPWNDEVKQWELSLRFSMGFYAGSLAARFRADQLQSQFAAALTEYSPPPDREQKQLVDCINSAEGPLFDKIRAPLEAAWKAKY